MFFKINSKTPASATILANTSQDRVIVVTSIICSSNVIRSFSISYEDGTLIQTVDATVGEIKNVVVESTIAKDRAGQGLIVSVQQGLSGIEEIGVVLEYNTIGLAAGL